MSLLLHGSWIDIQDYDLVSLRGALNFELLKELRSEHPSYDDIWIQGDPVAVAMCDVCDEVVFSLGNKSFAVVHLTWKGTTEKAPWPMVYMLASVDEVVSFMKVHGCVSRGRLFIDRDDGNLMETHTFDD